MDHLKLDLFGRQSQLFKQLGVLLVVLLFGQAAYGQPANDECVGATVIPSIPFVDSVDTTTATSNPADPSLSCNGGGGWTDGNTVWYLWTPAADITVNISTDGSTVPGGGSPLDTAHGVFTGSCAALTEVACVDIGLTDDLIFEATGGETYYIKFGEFLDGVGGGNLEVSVDLPPDPEVILESVRDGISDPISSLVVAAAATFTKSTKISTAREVPMLMQGDDKKSMRNDGKRLMRDGGKLSSFGENVGTLAESSLNEPLGAADVQSLEAGEPIDLLQIFDGAENDDNAFVLGTLLAPPDTDGDVGLNHYVQMTNLVTTIFDKSGNVVLGPFGNNVFWTGLGGLC